MSSEDALLLRAAEAGLQVRWTDVAGVEREVAPDVVDAVLRSLADSARAAGAAPPLLTCVVGQTLSVPGAGSGDAHWIAEDGTAQPARQTGAGQWQAPPTSGYWHWAQGPRLQAVAVAPQRSWFPAPGTGCRHWGVAAQVYSVPGTGDGGIGDSGGIAGWIPRLRAHGATAIALSPIHASMPIGSGLTTRGPRNLLRQIREAMAGGGPAQDRLDMVVRTIAQSMVAEVCSIYLRRASGELELFATEGLNPDAVHNTRLRPGEGLVGEVARELGAQPGAQSEAIADRHGHPRRHRAAGAARRSRAHRPHDPAPVRVGTDHEQAIGFVEGSVVVVETEKGGAVGFHALRSLPVALACGIRRGR